MALVAPEQVIDAPGRTPVPYGLFSVVTPVMDVADDDDGTTTPSRLRWEQGVVWSDQSNEVLPPVIVPDDAAPEGLPKDFTSVLNEGRSDPFTVYGEVVASPVGFSAQRAQEEATVRLITREEQSVTARIVALATGAGTLGGTSLAEVAPGQRFGALEQHLATTYASQGVIIASLSAFYFNFDHVIYTNGKVFTTAGTPIVIDRLSTADSTVIIPHPRIYSGEIMTSSNRMGDLFDQSNNDMFAIAERMYTVAWQIDTAAFSVVP